MRTFKGRGQRRNRRTWHCRCLYGWFAHARTEVVQRDNPPLTVEALIDALVCMQRSADAWNDAIERGIVRRFFS